MIIRIFSLKIFTIETKNGDFTMTWQSTTSLNFFNMEQKTGYHDDVAIEARKKKKGGDEMKIEKR